jgi:two-component system chemotaxis response regulator CheY
MVQELITIKLIADIIDNPNAKVFVCEDSDVVIIGTNIYTKVFDALTMEIYKLCQIANIREFASLHDVDNSWPLLYKIAKDKYNPIVDNKHAAEKQEQDLQKNMNKEICLSGKNIDPNLLRTISDRRQRRNSTNILIVEDDAFSRKLIRNVLSKEYGVVDVEDGQDALQSYALIAPDVTFLDIDLPDFNGHEILQAILRLDPNAYVIMLSGNSDQDNVIRAIKEGAKGFVAKPFLKDRLYKYINECPSILAKQGA